jgi:hypothetical protein
MKDLKTWQKAAGSIVGALVIGAIGSGIWQRAGDPLYVWIRDGALNLATLGMWTLKDSLYADVARGLHEAASSQLLVLALVGSTYAMFAFTILATGLARRWLPSFLVEKPRRSPDETKEKMEQDLRRMRRLVSYGLWPSMVVLIVGVAFTAIRISYTSSAIGYYQQLLNLVGPHVTADQVKVFNSRFAQIRSAQQYVTLTKEISGIARQHGLMLPDFEPW